MITSIRFLLLILFLTCTFQIRAAANQTLNDEWLHDATGYKRAMELTRELKVPLVVYFYTDWCPYCRALDELYLTHPAVQAYLRGVAKVRINPEHGSAERAIADKYGVDGYPQFYVSRGATALPRTVYPFLRQGTLTPEQFALVCQRVAPLPARSDSEVTTNATSR